MTTYREAIRARLNDKAETWNDVEHCTIPGEELDNRYPDDAGDPEYKLFFVFTSRRVYFPAVYEMGVKIWSVPRHPENITAGDVE